MLGYKCPAPLVSVLLCYHFLKKGASHSKRRRQTIIESLWIRVWLSSFSTLCIFAATPEGKSSNFTVAVTFATNVSLHDALFCAEHNVAGITVEFAH